MSEPTVLTMSSVVYEARVAAIKRDTIERCAKVAEWTPVRCPITQGRGGAIIAAREQIAAGIRTLANELAP